MPAKPAAVKASTLKDRVRINCAASNGLKSLLMDRDITTSVAGWYSETFWIFSSSGTSLVAELILS